MTFERHFGDVVVVGNIFYVLLVKLIVLVKLEEFRQIEELGIIAVIVLSPVLNGLQKIFFVLGHKLLDQVTSGLKRLNYFRFHLF